MLRDPSRQRERELGLGPEGPMLRALGDATTATATRAVMRFEIVSEMKMPSGHDPGVDVSILGVPITKGDGKQATQVKILDPLSLNAFALAGDPVDIGAKARRVVHTRLVDSEVL